MLHYWPYGAIVTAFALVVGLFALEDRRPIYRDPLAAGILGLVFLLITSVVVRAESQTALRALPWLSEHNDVLWSVLTVWFVIMVCVGIVLILSRKRPDESDAGHRHILPIEVSPIYFFGNSADREVLRSLRADAESCPVCRQYLPDIQELERNTERRLVL